MKTIIINRMFVGDYLDQGENIGHEIINLIRPDNKQEVYLWLNPYGNLTRHKIQEDDVMLMIRGNPYEVFAMATGLKIVPGANTITKNGQVNNENSLRHQKELSLIYDGCYIHDILGGNVCNHEKEKSLIATFSATTVRKVNNNKKIFIKRIDNNKTDSNDTINRNDNIITILTSKNLTKQSLRMYIESNKSNEETKLFKNLEEIINDNSLWEDPQEITTFNHNKYSGCDINFFNILGCQDKELSFSNALAYLLRYNKEILKSFVEKCLCLNNDWAIDDYEISREKDNIDIFIKSNKHLIVIENKIHSDINGVFSKDSNSNLEKQNQWAIGKIYSEKEQKLVNDSPKDFDQETKVKKEPSQLSKYYLYSYHYAKKHNIDFDNNVKFYIFSPNYQKTILNTNRISKIYHYADKYKFIEYKSIYDWLKNKVDHSLFGNIEKYIDDILNALSKHISDYDDYKEVEMWNRLARKIKNIKSKK